MHIFQTRELLTRAKYVFIQRGKKCLINHKINNLKDLPSAAAF